MLGLNMFLAGGAVHSYPRMSSRVECKELQKSSSSISMDSGLLPKVLRAQ